MKTITLTLLAVAGTASLATATPQDREPTERVSYTKQPMPRDVKPTTPGAHAGDWLQLTTPTPCVHGRSVITFEADATPFTILRVDVHKGRPVINGMRVTFRDGTQRHVKLEKRLEASKTPSLYVDLRGSKSITSIVIDTDWKMRCSYTIHGAPDRKAVARR